MNSYDTEMQVRKKTGLIAAGIVLGIAIGCGFGFVWTKVRLPVIPSLGRHSENNAKCINCGREFHVPDEHPNSVWYHCPSCHLHQPIFAMKKEYEQAHK